MRATSRPVAVSHIRAVLSPLAGARSCVYIEDATVATVLALEKGSLRSAYNVVGNRADQLGAFMGEIPEAVVAPPLAIPRCALRLAPYA